MKKEWRVYSRKAEVDRIAARFGILPLTAHIITCRGKVTENEIEKYLYGNMDDLHDPGLMMGMDKGVEIIAEKIKAGSSIRVVGDYDADGVTSTYILLDGLKNLGAVVSYDIPDRIRDGYGMNIRIVEDAAAAGVDTIITCDNGVAAVTSIKKAKELGMTVVVTDHHEPQDEMPDADVIIDPHQIADKYPYKEICGAMVAYKFVQALYKYMGVELPAGKYVEFAAIATVCDVMPLLDENRILVREGLRTILNTENVGLKALVEATGLPTQRKLNTRSFSFVVGPCINTKGRLESAKDVVELFLEEDPEQAKTTAEYMVELNNTRKEMTTEGERPIMEMLEAKESEGSLDKVIVVYAEGLHESLAGLVAGHIEDRFYRPAIVFTDALGNPDVYKGSARSIEAYNVFEALCEAKEYLVKFGGHKQAAGLTIRKSDIDDLRSFLNEKQQLTEADLTDKIHIDSVVPLHTITFSLIEQLDSMEPCGEENDEPLFGAPDMELLGIKIKGRNNNVMELKVRDKNDRKYLITSFRPDDVMADIKKWFNEEDCDRIMKGIAQGLFIDFTFKPYINEYMGKRTVEYLLKDYRPA